MKRILSFILAKTIILSLSYFVFAKIETTSGTPVSTYPSDWAKEDVNTAFELGILDNEKTYYYTNYITREEFCEIAYNLFFKTYIGTYKTQKATIKDTDSKAVKYLVQNGIINGKSKDSSGIKFSPDDFLTREESAVIFQRLINAVAIDIPYTDDIIEYDDEENISDWAFNGIQFVSHVGLMNGYNGNVFYPKANLSTEEAITVIIRAYDLITNTRALNKTASFADKLNSQMPNDENYMFSPLSVKMALMLAANGAKGETQRELIETIDERKLENVNESLKKLIERYSQSDKLSLSIANSIWVNTDNCPYDFTDSYKSTVENIYGAASEKVNNKNAVRTINDWVKDKTNSKIPTIIEDSDFWTALVNAIYFKGAWEKDFNIRRTKKDTFKNSDGTTASTDFMNQTDNFSYAKNDEAEIVELRYKTDFYEKDKNGDYISETIAGVNASMYFIKTDSSDIERILDDAKFEYKRVRLSVPKFKINYSDEISKYLMLNYATNKLTADFSAMINLNPDERLWIDKIIHKTFISVDENGTEASAATAVMMGGLTSAKPEDPIDLKFDEPFYFVIRDETRKEILFMGRYAYAK